jgi:hypothetical protein
VVITTVPRIPRIPHVPRAIAVVWYHAYRVVVTKRIPRDPIVTVATGGQGPRAARQEGKKQEN